MTRKSTFRKNIISNQSPARFVRDINNTVVKWVLDLRGHFERNQFTTVNIPIEPGTFELCFY